MLKRFMILSMSLLAGTVLAACSSSSDAPARMVEKYLNTLVAKDADRLPTLVCGDWEEDALIELDSFQAVEARLFATIVKSPGALKRGLPVA